MTKLPRKTRVALALAAAISGSAFIPQAQAINLAADGLGQVAVFPYYTAREGWDTYIHLTNTSDRTALLKIRFREHRNSREVRDFNIILSPHDVWTAAVGERPAWFPTGTLPQQGSTVGVWSDDASCTSPILPSLGGPFRGIEFTSAAYTGVNTDFGSTNIDPLDRTFEGYAEVFLMAHSSVPEELITEFDEIEWDSQHVGPAGNRVPRDCLAVDEQFNQFVGNPAFDTFRDPNTSFPLTANIIKAHSSLINVADGRAVGVEPTMIANCNIDDIYRPQDLSPDFANCTNIEATLLDDTSNPSTLQVVQDAFPFFPEDATSALLTRRYVINEWTTAAATNASTDWVVTFPTKHFYTDDTLRPPFTEEFQEFPNPGIIEPAASCDDVDIRIWDREELSPENRGGTQFSPPLPGGSLPQLCNEANVVTFNDSFVLGSPVGLDVITTAVGDRGWAQIDLDPNDTTSLSGLSYTYRGLPVIGFALSVRNNAVLADGQNRNYATAQEHSYRREITSGATVQ